MTTGSAAFDAIVIGAGFAGLSAAARLAGAGARVLVLEVRPRLGGRATAFPDRATGELVDNGQHVLFGCYHETFAFLRRIGAEDFVRLQPALSVPFLDEDGAPSELRCPPLPAPYHLLAGVLDWDALPFADRLSALRLARPIRLARRLALAREAERGDPGPAPRQAQGALSQSKSASDALGGVQAPSQGFGGPGRSPKSEVRGAPPMRRPARRDRHLAVASPGETVSTWLKLNGQGPAICQWLWYPLAFAALNQSPDEAAAPPFVEILARLFGSDPRDAAIGLPTRHLHLMYAEPARAFIEARRGAVRTGALATVTLDGARVREVEVGRERFLAPVVISTVPWFALASLIVRAAPLPPEMEETIDQATRIVSLPIVTVNLWYDRAVMDHPFVGVKGGSTHWIFDRRATLGTETSHLSLVTSGAKELVALTNEEIVGRASADTARVLARAARARLVRGTVIREKRATFSLAPGQPPRPGARTPVAGFFLAGDWTDTGLPGTIESAVVSGHRAANLVLGAGC